MSIAPKPLRLSSQSQIPPVSAPILPYRLHVSAARRAVQPKEASNFSPAVILAILAVVSNLLVPPNFLQLIGYNYIDQGGNPLTKLHPGTYISFLAFGAFLFEQGSPSERLRKIIAERRATVFYCFVMVSGIFYASLASGASALSIYLESWVPAGILAIILSYSTVKARRTLAVIIFCLIAGNTVVGLIETAINAHVVPLYFGTHINAAEIEKFDLESREFRAYALYDHPLTAAMMTMMGIFILIDLGWRRLYFYAGIIFFMLGLFAFGGRTALVVVISTLAVWGSSALVARAARGLLRPSDIAIALGATTVVPALFGLILATTSLGERIVKRFYWDDSASIRAYQWNILKYLDLHDWLFGVGPAQLDALKWQIGLSGPFMDIENFWLAMFVGLGIVGYVVFLVAFFLFLRSLWKRASPAARVMLVTVILVASSSNSLARKSRVLTILVPAVLCASSIGASRRPFARQVRRTAGVPSAAVPPPEMKEAEKMALRIKPTPRPLRRPFAG